MNKHNHRPRSILARGIAALGLALACCGAWAVPTIQSVSGAVQNGSEIVRIDLSEAPAALPAGVAIQ